MLVEVALPALVLVVIGWLWHSMLGAREAAREHARRLCAQSRLQLLDETVALQFMRPQRDRHGDWQWHRTYGFEVSSDHADRLHGSLQMIGEKLTGSSLPSTRNDLENSAG